MKAEWRICTSSLNCAIICSDSGLSPVRHQAIIWTTGGLLSVGLSVKWNWTYRCFHWRKCIRNFVCKMPFCRYLKVLKWPVDNKIRPANWLKKKWVNKTIPREQKFSAESLLIISINSVIRLFMLALARTLYFIRWYMNPYFHIIFNISCRRCSNYIFILNLTSGFNGLGKDNYQMRREAFKFRDLGRLILETLRWYSTLYWWWLQASISGHDSTGKVGLQIESVMSWKQ